jgi:glycosyltransferase involved in cell wall biosynthesis
MRSSLELRDRFDFEFVLPKNSQGRIPLEKAGFVVHELPMVEIRRQLRSLLIYFPMIIVNVFRILALVRRREVSLIVNNDFYNLIPAFARVLSKRATYVSYVRFMPSKFPPALVKFWYTMHLWFAENLIAVSHAVVRELPPSEKLLVVYNELPTIETAYERNSGHVILYPANFIQGKGQDVAVDVFSRLALNDKQWKLRFIGGDLGLAKNRYFKERLQKRAVELNCSENIEWINFSDRMADHYKEASLVLNFSESESFSLTTLEAQYFGRPVIVTRCGGPEEIVVDGETGILVEVKDVDAMAKAIEYLTENYDVREKMGARAYSHVREKFSHENTSGKLAEVYRSAIKK